MDQTSSLAERWARCRPSKTLYFWSCVASAVAAIAIGFTWGGWMTAASAADQARNAARQAKLDLAATICVDRFEHAAAERSALADLKKLEYWQRGDFIRKGDWLKLPGVADPLAGAARLCADRLVKTDVEAAGGKASG